MTIMEFGGTFRSKSCASQKFKPIPKCSVKRLLYLVEIAAKIINRVCWFYFLYDKPNNAYYEKYSTLERSL